MDRYQYSTDEDKINRIETNHRKSVEDKQSCVVLFLLGKINNRFWICGPSFKAKQSLEFHQISLQRTIIDD